MREKGGKIYGVSAKLVYSGIAIVLIVALVLGVSVIINNGSITPLLGMGNNAQGHTPGIFTVAISQNSGYNWTLVTVRFVPANTVYSEGVPNLSWAPPQVVNVTGGLPSNVTRYVNMPITSGPVYVGANITGSVWAKYQLQLGGEIFYAKVSSAFIAVKR